ncbi:hypothetical protein D3C81_673580 [compost metagenome]
MLLPKVKISISDAYFFDAQTMADFFNRIGRLLPASNSRNRQKQSFDVFAKTGVIQYRRRRSVGTDVCCLSERGG